MKILAISGSMRRGSSNSFLLQSIANIAKPEFECHMATGLDSLPIFSPDLEGAKTPLQVVDFVSMVAESAGIIISSPEYVRAIPSGLKNAIDWLVSRDEIINKPIAIVHASRRGDDMLDSLRSVLSTVSQQFCSSCFLRIPLMSQSAEEMTNTITKPENNILLREFVRDYHGYIKIVSHS
jgi:NAD(P)H-dependent FMN reductase